VTEMLSPHFTLDEFLVSQTASREGIDNTPTPEHKENLKRTAEVMESVRRLLGDQPITVLSGYRSVALNDAVGGSATSAHCFGLACDFTCPGFGTPHEICLFLAEHVELLDIDQLIDEYPPTGWVHIGLSEGEARCQVAMIDGSGFHVVV